MMKRLNLTSVIIIVIIIIAVITNPSPEEHKQAVKELFNQHIQKSLSEEDSNDFEKAGILLGSSLAENLIENSISRDNYILFSTTISTWEGKSKSIGYGFFGNVFLSEDIKSRLERDN